MKIAEVAQTCGLSAHTIRFYEKNGLLPIIERASDGHRRFTKENVDWLILLASLRETGMPSKKMQHFARLYQQGNVTLPERRQILLKHQDILKTRAQQLQDCQALLKFKLARYDDILGEIK